MKRIAVDIDDTIAVHMPEIIAYSNEKYGTNLTVDTYTEMWIDFWDVDIEEVMRRARDFHKKTVANYQRMEDADEVLRKLALKYKLVIVTARHDYNIEPTYAWLDEYYKGIFEEVHFVPVWEPDNKVTKADICMRIGADYLIDDIPRHCNVAAESGITSLLFGGYTWSKDHVVHPEVIRLNSWKAIGEYFDAAS